MSKIPFTLDAWLKDKSQKIETAFGEPAKVVFAEGLGKYPILAVIYDGDTTDSAWFTKDGKSYDGVYGLFIVTQDEELTEFESNVRTCITKNLTTHIKDGSCVEISSTVFIDDDTTKKLASELFSLVREQVIKDGYIIEKKAFHDAVEKVDSGVIKDVSAHIDFENLIHNLGKRYPEVSFAKLARIAKVAYQKGMEEALKDLPRWEKYPHNAGEEPLVNGILQKDGTYKWRLYLDGYKIEISDLEKLPGFKED